MRYEDRSRRTAPSGDGPRLGVVGSDVPRPLVLAHGAVPVRLSGSWSGSVPTRAAALLGAVDVAAAHVLAHLLDGGHEHLAGIVVCHDSAAHLRIFYVLRVLAERGDLPVPVHLLDAPRCEDPTTGWPDPWPDGTHPTSPRIRFVEQAYHRLAEWCGRVTGRRPTSDELAAAWRSEALIGEALERLRDRRAGGRVTGPDALEAYRAATTLPPGDAVEVVDAITDRQATRAGAGPVPIVVTGSHHTDASVYEEIERQGARIVADDHDTGDSTWIVPTGADRADADLGAMIGALARAHARRPPSAARSRSAVRADHLLAQVEATGARGVLSLAREHDDAPAWDAPVQDAALRRADIPFVARTRITDDPLGEAAVATAELVAAVPGRSGVGR